MGGFDRAIPVKQVDRCTGNPVRRQTSGVEISPGTVTQVLGEALRGD